MLVAKVVSDERFSDSARKDRRSLKWLGAIATLACASGCVQSPHDLQEIATQTSPIPFQTTTTYATLPVYIECAQASHGGAYSGPNGVVWTQVTTLLPSQVPLYDVAGNKLYSANGMVTLPSNCWRYDSVYSRYFVAVRVKQVGQLISWLNGQVTPSPVYFSVFDKPGLECLGKAVGAARTWTTDYAACEVPNNPDKYLLLYSKQ